MKSWSPITTELFFVDATCKPFTQWVGGAYSCNLVFWVIFMWQTMILEFPASYCHLARGVTRKFTCCIFECDSRVPWCQSQISILEIDDVALNFNKIMSSLENFFLYHGNCKGIFFWGGRRIPSGITAVGQGAECPPTLLTGKFLVTYWYGEKSGKEKGGKWRRKEWKSWKGRWKIEWKEENLQNEERTLTSPPPPFLFTFKKPLKFVLGLPEWEFSTAKKHFTPGKK